MSSIITPSFRKRVSDILNLVSFLFSGNHDLWRKGSAEQSTGKKGTGTGPPSSKQALATCSFSKLTEVLRCAQACEVHTGPLKLLPPPRFSSSSPTGCLPLSVKVLPLFSWYHSGWDTEPSLEHPDFLKAEKVNNNITFSNNNVNVIHLFFRAIMYSFIIIIHNIHHYDYSCSLSTRSGLTSACVPGPPRSWTRRRQ